VNDNSNGNGFHFSTSSIFFETSSDEEDEELLQSKATANLIHSSLTSELFSIQTFIQPEEMTNIQIDSNSKEEDKMNVEEVQVPQSISEIYKLSNQIKRKRNKDKQKGKDEMDQDKNDDDPEENLQKKRQKGPDKDGTSVEFMKDIGWIDRQDSSNSSHHNFNSRIGNKSSVVKDAINKNIHSKEKQQIEIQQYQLGSTQQPLQQPKFTPFDYSANSGSRTGVGTTAEQQNYFNPYNKAPQTDFQRKNASSFGGKAGQRSGSFRPKSSFTSSNSTQQWPKK